MDNGLDFALMEFEHTEGAEEAYSRAPRSVGGVAWADQVAFVEHHRRNRIIVRGTFAGRYVDADDELEFVGKKTAEGAIAGAAIGLFGGPVGLAVGLVGGGLAGGVAQERSSPHLRGAFFDELRRDVPEGSSAVTHDGLAGSRRRDGQRARRTRRSGGPAPPERRGSEGARGRGRRRSDRRPAIGDLA